MSIFIRHSNLSSDNHLPEDGHSVPKRTVAVSYIYTLLSFHCCAVVGMNIGNWFTARMALNTGHRSGSLNS
jgi:hypothetical protein